MIVWITIVLLAGLFAGLSWRLARRVRSDRKRLEMELRLADAFETFHEEVFKLKHYPVLRPNSSGRKADLIPSTNMSSLRYIKGRQNED